MRKPTGMINKYHDGDRIELNMDWPYAHESVIHSGSSVMYKAVENRKNITVAIDAGHGTRGGDNQQTFCHPDHSASLYSCNAPAPFYKLPACATGMRFRDGTPERDVNLTTARFLKNLLLAEGYDVLMVRDETTVQLDVIARTVICNHTADCHISVHFDGDGRDYNKGCFYLSVEDPLKDKEPVASVWRQHEQLGKCLLQGLTEQGCLIFCRHGIVRDLMQTAYSSIPSVDIELGNQCFEHTDAALKKLAEGLRDGINSFFRS